ncbi:MAG: hypothetical protein JO025_17705 [Verrucomicrobia bacterium]|nr:hypothetical protein [Verrucomicrobiota bacterium]
MRLLPHPKWLRSASELTAVVLFEILVSVAEIGCTHYIVEPLPGSSLSQIVSPSG